MADAAHQRHSEPLGTVGSPRSVADGVHCGLSVVYLSQTVPWKVEVCAKLDITGRRSTVIGQCNNVIAWFNKLDCCAKTRLLKCYCSTVCGCELCSVTYLDVQILCVARLVCTLSTIYNNSNSKNAVQCARKYHFQTDFYIKSTEVFGVSLSTETTDAKRRAKYNATVCVRVRARLCVCVNCRKYMAARASLCEPHLARWDNGCLQSVRQQDGNSCGPFVLLVSHT